MNVALSITEAMTYKAMGQFIERFCLPGTNAYQAQANRVPEALENDFVLMNVIHQQRLATNVDEYADALFIGNIVGTTMTIEAVTFGEIRVNSPVLGVGIIPGTIVTALGTGIGGIGTYDVNNAQNIASQVIACGTSTKMQSMAVTIQLDVHGDQSADNAVIISTLMRDEAGVDQFASSDVGVTPLYCSDPRQMPFLNDQQQIEQRWIVDAVVQCNPVLTLAQEYASVLSVSVLNVDATYPAQ